MLHALWRNSVVQTFKRPLSPLRVTIVAIQFKPFKTTKRVDRCNAVQAFWKHRERPAGYELQNVVLSVLLEKLLHALGFFADAAARTRKEGVPWKEEMSAAFGQPVRKRSGWAGRAENHAAGAYKPRQHHVPAVLKVQELQGIKWHKDHLKTKAGNGYLVFTCLVCLLTSEQVNLQNLCIVCSRKSY